MIAPIAALLVATFFSAPDEPTCSKLGTAVPWEESITVASERAEKEGKLVLALHVSGEFDDPAST